ncbi:hypothetical protein RIF29_03957 [Crotalaria pallida]|uniref:Uncharacterized protein n=1 Tax=Crotalaria pallida TaxID=3830 RepID=A0AAN9J0I9_CROPI
MAGLSSPVLERIPTLAAGASCWWWLRVGSNDDQVALLLGCAPSGISRQVVTYSKINDQIISDENSPAISDETRRMRREKEEEILQRMKFMAKENLNLLHPMVTQVILPSAEEINLAQKHNLILNSGLNSSRPP